jgi:glycosyltransferase involved in cell wall biosynthesis
MEHKLRSKTPNSVNIRVMSTYGRGKKIQKPLVSIITPCFNEAENISMCYERTKKIMDDLLPKINYEHIFADNCSTDGTIIELRKIAKKDKNVKVIRNSTNVGPFRNMYGALKFASGDAIVPMLPADLQDPPEVIPEFIELWQKGNLVIYGKRIKRAEPLPMKLIRKM